MTTENNRTGVSIDPDRTKAMLEDVRAAEPSPGFDAGEADAIRIDAQRQAPAVGSMPPMVAPQKATAAVLLDKMGERLAFERSGARLYELLMLKLESSGGFPGGPARDDLVHIRNEELEHFGMLSQAIGSHGGDPTAVTPLANVSAVESSGLVQVLSDPRTTLADGLHAILVAELVDGVAWEELVELARELSYPDLFDRFQLAAGQEREHLRRVRAWLAGDLHLRLSA